MVRMSTCLDVRRRRSCAAEVRGIVMHLQFWSGCRYSGRSVSIPGRRGRGNAKNATNRADASTTRRGLDPQRPKQPRQPLHEHTPAKCCCRAFGLNPQSLGVAGGIAANHGPGLLKVTSRPENTQGQFRVVLGTNFAGGLLQTGNWRLEIAHSTSSQRLTLFPACDSPIAIRCFAHMPSCGRADLCTSFVR